MIRGKHVHVDAARKEMDNPAVCAQNKQKGAGVERFLSSICRMLSFALNIWGKFVCLLICCLTSQQHASVSQGRIRLDNFTCCHTEIEAADPTFYLTQSQYTDTGPTNPNADPIRKAPGRVASGVTKF